MHGQVYGDAARRISGACQAFARAMRSDERRGNMLVEVLCEGVCSHGNCAVSTSVCFMRCPLSSTSCGLSS